MVESIQQLYLIGLITGAVLTLIYMLLSDLLEGMFEALADGIFNPTLILSFLTFICANGYLMELMTPLNSILIFVLSLAIAFVLVTLLNVFVLTPLSSAEATLAYSEEDLKGRIGEVITSIPADGFGEVLLKGYGGNIAKSAVSLMETRLNKGPKL